MRITRPACTAERHQGSHPKQKADKASTNPAVRRIGGTISGRGISHGNVNQRQDRRLDPDIEICFILFCPHAHFSNILVFFGDPLVESCVEPVETRHRVSIRTSYYSTSATIPRPPGHRNSLDPWSRYLAPGFDACVSTSGHHYSTTEGRLIEILKCQVTG